MRVAIRIKLISGILAVHTLIDIAIIIIIIINTGQAEN